MKTNKLFPNELKEIKGTQLRVWKNTTNQKFSEARQLDNKSIYNESLQNSGKCEKYSLEIRPN